MFSRELWRKIKQKSGLENRCEGCNLHREVREDLADVTFDERSEEGHTERGRAAEKQQGANPEAEACLVVGSQTSKAASLLE